MPTRRQTCAMDRAAGRAGRRRRRTAGRRSSTLPALERLQPVQAAQERALAAAGGADDRGHLAPRDGEAHAAQDLERAVPLDQVVDLDHASAPPFTPPAPSRRSDQRENHDSGTLITM